MERLSLPKSYYSTIGRLAGGFFRDRPVVLLTGGTAEEAVSEVPGARLNSPEDFERCAALRVTEIRALMVRADQPRRPDTIVLELSSGPGQARALVRAAEAARELLRELGLRSVWKAAGAGALDLLVPIERLYEPASVFDFGEMLAEMIFERDPRHCTLKRQAGTERALVDYHGNHSGRMILAPFSPRRGAGHAFLSLPFAPEDLEDQLSSGEGVRLPPLTASKRELERAGTALSEAYAALNELERVFAIIEVLAQELG